MLCLRCAVRVVVGLVVCELLCVRVLFVIAWFVCEPLLDVVWFVCFVGCVFVVCACVCLLCVVLICL